MRSYTPTTLDDDKGHFELVVKVSLGVSRGVPDGGRADERCYGRINHVHNMFIVDRRVQCRVKSTAVTKSSAAVLI